MIQPSHMLYLHIYFLYLGPALAQPGDLIVIIYA